MSHSKSHSIVVGYYLTNDMTDRQTANRCSAEIAGLCKQLVLIRNELILALRRKHIEDVLDLCQYHYENYLFRVYSIRERAWDALAQLADISRDYTGKKKFRESVLSNIETDYPPLAQAFSRLHATIELDVEQRNVATHRTFLWLGLAFGEDFEDIYDFETVMTWYDPDSEEGLTFQRKTREELRKFVNAQHDEIQTVVTIAHAFSTQCDNAIIQKWS